MIDVSSTLMSARDPAAENRGGEGFDKIVERLRGVVERLEAGNLSLEESLAAFEEGVRLSRRGTEILDAAERRVEVLIRGEDGAEKAAPFQVGSGGAEGGGDDGGS
jgi:exodeoxyribonuclease VII small subunit